MARLYDDVLMAVGLDVAQYSPLGQLRLLEGKALPTSVGGQNRLIALLDDLERLG